MRSGQKESYPSDQVLKSKPMYNSSILLLPLFALLVAASQDGCEKWRKIANKVKDSDSDGWMDENTNQKIDLRIDGLNFGSGTVPFSLVVDDRILVDKGTNLPTSTIASTRYAGQWHVGNLLTYTARVKIFTDGNTETATVRNFTFHNRDSAYQTSFTLGTTTVAVSYRSAVTPFADPSPLDANADSDNDGIRDHEEAELARGNFRIGDPNTRDIAVCIGTTAPKWALTKRSIERITTVFLNRGLNLLLADESTDLPGLMPGQVSIREANGTLSIPPESRGVALSSVGDIRTRHVSAALDPFTHMLVAADHCIGFDFGIAGKPGRNVVIRSHFYLLGPDPLGFEYQALVAMHELGHNFGLCHPNESDDTCTTGAIPVSERNGASSCMGSPADDGGLFNGPIPNTTAISNAFNRPLDYSPTQWTNMNPALSRN